MGRGRPLEPAAGKGLLVHCHHETWVCLNCPPENVEDDTISKQINLKGKTAGQPGVCPLVRTAASLGPGGVVLDMGWASGDGHKGPLVSAGNGSWNGWRCLSVATDTGHWMF